MKSLPWILVCLLVCVIVWMRCNPHDPSTVYVKGDTIRVRDTIVDIVLMPVKETLKRTDTVYLPIIVDTTTDRTVEGDFTDRFRYEKFKLYLYNNFHWKKVY